MSDLQDATFARPIDGGDPILVKDPKIISKYKWRPTAEFDEDSSSESDDDFNEQFKKILSYRPTASGEELIDSAGQQPKSQSVKDAPKLDKDYYQIPDLGNLSLACYAHLQVAPFGTVFQHFDSLLLIKALPEKPYLDLDSMLFLADRTPIGQIYELMGLVTDPIYGVLFSNASDLAAYPVGVNVYYAPMADSKVTHILHVADLENNSKWNTDHGSDSEQEEDDEEAKYFADLRRQLVEYERRKRERRNSVSSNASSYHGPQSKHPRRHY